MNKFKVGDMVKVISQISMHNVPIGTILELNYITDPWILHEYNGREFFIHFSDLKSVNY